MIDVFLKFFMLLFRDPRAEAFAIVGITTYIKKIMSENQEKIYLDNEPEEMVKTEQPLWLPAGSVRAIITLFLVMVSTISFMIPEMKIPLEYNVLTIGAVAYYVGYRATVKK